MVTAIIQARLGSTRLPGKVLKEILGKPMLELMINRLKQSKTI
ncbi:MAG: acylneuraminate cytidylyltransferase, partial [Patescibacteria group bacterium]